MTFWQFRPACALQISIHTLRVEGDRRRGAVPVRPYPISIHTLRVEGDERDYQRCAGGTDISIHTLRVEGDTIPRLKTKARKISIHTLRVEGDLACGLTADIKVGFQSTPSAWRVTISSVLVSSTMVFQSTPSAWRVTRRYPEGRIAGCDFNPHPPRGG